MLASLLAVVADGFSELIERSTINFLIMLAMLVTLFLVGKYIDKRPWSEFGITVLPLRQFFSGALLGSALVSIIFALQYALGWLELDEIRFNQFPAVSFGVVFAGQVFRYLCGSVFEEVFSRGYLLLNIAEGLFGKWTAAQAVGFAYLITSSLFGLLHLANDGASLLSSINLILLGLLFGWMMIKTGKLHFSIGLHAFWNIFQNNIFGFANSGKASIASWYTFENSGATLWTGGEFGIEGGLLCTLVVSLALLVLSYREIFGNRKLEQQILK
ncbi:MAG: CPBP family intramembrane glutamic endopeptidase [Bacteroidota bacterium]